MGTGRKTSLGLQQRAAHVLPLGVNSNTRYWGENKNLYIEKARGAYVWDVDGNRYIDYRLAFGPVILGYAYDEVDEEVIKALRRGVTVGLTHELEICAAEKVAAMCPAVELVRFVNSGTEAVMHSLRLARAFTGREKVVKFEGGYHGSLDYLLYSTYAPPEAYGSRFNPIPMPASSGIPAALRNLVVTLPFNDPEALEKTLSSIGHQTAAIITEPMLGNYGSVDPHPGFLAFLRQKCDQYGIVLIFDEIKTGFRIAPGGAQEVYAVMPDLTAYAKSIGNGYPVAAYGGRREINGAVGLRRFPGRHLCRACHRRGRGECNPGHFTDPAGAYNHPGAWRKAAGRFESDLRAGRHPGAYQPASGNFLDQLWCGAGEGWARMGQERPGILQLFCGGASGCGRFNRSGPQGTMVPVLFSLASRH